MLPLGHAERGHGSVVRCPGTGVRSAPSIAQPQRRGNRSLDKPGRTAKDARGRRERREEKERRVILHSSPRTSSASSSLCASAVLSGFRLPDGCMMVAGGKRTWERRRAHGAVAAESGGDLGGADARDRGLQYARAVLCLLPAGRSRRPLHAGADALVRRAQLGGRADDDDHRADLGRRRRSLRAQADGRAGDGVRLRPRRPLLVRAAAVACPRPAAAGRRDHRHRLRLRRLRRQFRPQGATGLQPRPDTDGGLLRRVDRPVRRRLSLGRARLPAHALGLRLAARPRRAGRPRLRPRGLQAPGRRRRPSAPRSSRRRAPICTTNSCSC